MLAHITDFMPYFYVPTPRGLLEEDLPQFVFYLNVSTHFTYIVLYWPNATFRVSREVAVPSGTWNSLRSGT